LIVVGLLLAVFGGLCLNYTTADGAEHHRQFALERGLPAPSAGIYYMGLACALGGAALFGFALGRPRR
jgi:hypothetical protein